MKPKKYRVNEIFYSIQGEGMRAGTPNVFVRFSGCNMDCHQGHEEENADFDCDTEFVSGLWMEGEDIIQEAMRLTKNDLRAVIFTGGEPGLQLDKALVDAFKSREVFTAIETNGTIDVSGCGVEWVTVSPKIAEHALKMDEASEVKYVRHHGQGIPKPTIKSPYRLISPAFKGRQLDMEAAQWCQMLVLENPDWILSLQTHKWVDVR